MHKKSTCSTTTRLEQLDYFDHTYTIKSTGLRMRTCQEEPAKKEIKVCDMIASYHPISLSVYNCWHCYKVILYQGQKSWKTLESFHSFMNISFFKKKKNAISVCYMFDIYWLTQWYVRDMVLKLLLEYILNVKVWW